MKKPDYLKWNSILVFTAIIVFFIGCCDCKNPIKNYRESEYTFIIAPNTDPDSFCQSLKMIFPDNKNIVCTTCACDSLVLVTGLDDVSILGQGGLVAATSKVKPQGGDLPGVISYGRNYLLELPPVNMEYKYDRNHLLELPPVNKEYKFDTLSEIKFISPAIDTSRIPLLIGVMDTGFDQRLLTSSFLYNNGGQSDSCYKDDRYGWNFVDKTNDIRDDHVNRHGTFVTQLIVNQGLGSNVKIIPLKVIDANKQGELFHLMCAMSYAARKNVNIINASLGYYGQRDHVLEKYLDVLKKKNILLVTSAGNKNEETDSGEMGDVRNLDDRINKFYPACYNDQYPNIVSVTTANRQRLVSTVQNYSYNFVDIAVIPKAPNNVGSQPLFNVSYTAGGNNNSIQLEGSSFATPVVTGRIIKTILNSSMPPPYARSTFLYPTKKLNGLTNSSVYPLQPKVSRGYRIDE